MSLNKIAVDDKEATKTAKDFADACMNLDADKFTENAQFSWIERIGTPKIIEGVMSRFHLISSIDDEVQIVEVSPISCWARIPVSLRDGDSQMYILRMKLIKEIRPMITDEGGKWGVNPNSLMVE